MMSRKLPAPKESNSLHLLDVHTRAAGLALGGGVAHTAGLAEAGLHPLLKHHRVGLLMRSIG